MSFLKTGIKVVEVAGAIGTVATIGEVVGERVGVLKPGTSLIRSVANAALDVVDLPMNLRFGRAPALAGAPALGAAPSGRTVCPDCQGTAPIAIEGGPVSLLTCEKHAKETHRVADAIGGLYYSYAEFALGAAPSKCKKPEKSTYINKFAPQGFDTLAWQAALISWQNCVQEERAAMDAAAKAKADADAAAKKQTDAAVKKAQASAAKTTKFLLSQQSRAYDTKLADLQAQQAQNASAATQAQIDQLTAQKAAAEKMLADAQAAQKDSAMQAKLDALQAQIVNAGTKPGGVDDLLRQYVLQQMMPMAPSPEMPQEQAMYAAQMQPPPVFVVPWDAAPQQEMYSDPYAYAQYAGAVEGAPTPKKDARPQPFADESPFDPEMASSLGFPEGITVGEAEVFTGLRGAGWDIDSLLEGIGEAPVIPATSCTIGGGCGR